MSSLPQLYDAKGQTILLGRKLGEGGQAAVFEVQGAPHLAAKWYNNRNQPDFDQALKLAGMARGSDPALNSISAWPITTLHKNPAGPVVGFIMPKMSGYRPVHVLYSPANRKFSFPKADWSFLVHTARNVASAIAAIHAHGHVVGDINQNNVLVAENGTAKLIDCDSFQMRVDGRNFLCDVGVPEFTPPELHGRSFAGLTRTPNHDAFGLAVMIFHLLFMGRHPFAGRFLGRGDKPIEEAIKEFRFAFGQAAASRQMALPPHSLTLLQTSIDLASLFERAFSEAAARASIRPTAQEWLTALDKFRGELVACPAVPAHKLHRSLNKCPWCSIQQNAGPDFFISITIGATIISATTFDLRKAWAAITAISPPDTNALIVSSVSTSTITPAPFPPYLGFTKNQALWLRIGIFAVAGATIAGLPFAFSLALTVALLVLHYYVAPNGQERRRRKAEVTKFEQSISAKHEEWANLVNNFKIQFQTKLTTLEASKNRYDSLFNSKRQELEQLKQAREKEQRKDFLERHFIKNYQVDGIGWGRRATLLAYGIETLHDITPAAIDQVPGFGPSLTSALVTLRITVEAQFRFDPNKGVNPATVAAIEQKYALQRVPLEKILLTGPQELDLIHRTANQQRTAQKDSLTKLTSALSQAKVNGAVTENDPWRFIVAIVLVFGFIFRFAIGGIHKPELQHTTEVVESNTTASDAGASGGKGYQPKKAATPAGDKPAQVAPSLASHEPAKPADDESFPPAEAELKRLRASFIQKMRERRDAAAKTLALHESERQRISEEYERLRNLYSQGQITQMELLQTEQVLAEASGQVEADKQWLRETNREIQNFNR